MINKNKDGQSSQTEPEDDFYDKLMKFLICSDHLSFKLQYFICSFLILNHFYFFVDFTFMFLYTLFTRFCLRII